MNFASLAEWLAWQEQLHPSEIELGLNRVKQVAACLPFFFAQPPIKTLIIGGTNGKGSCVAYLEAILIAAGYRVGAYSSPHLLRYNERIRINGVMAEDSLLCDSFARINQARATTSLTYFEFGTLAALDIFYRQGVDVQILEVGLGGRLDAVNIMEPDGVIVVNVALDHQSWLGESREQIGTEKAGIFRAGIPLVVGEAEPPVSLRDAATRLGNSALRLCGRDFGIDEVAGQWQFYGRDPEGQSLQWLLPKGKLPRPSAACALQLLVELGWVQQGAAATGLLRADLPGRCQRWPWQGREIILDVAHNPAGAEYLTDWLRQQQCHDVHIVFSALADKDYPAVMAALQGLGSHWYLAPLPVPRATPLEKLRQSVVNKGVPVQGFDTIAAALQAALAASRPGETILVTGSFYTVSEAIGYLAGGNNEGKRSGN